VRRSDEVEAQRRRWTFYETIKGSRHFCAYPSLHPENKGAR
jgi:hypothetical protein